MVKGLYPFSTQDGQSIPLDIISPAGLLRKSFAVNGMPAQASVGEDAILVMFSDQDCYISFGADYTAMTDGVFSPNTLYLQGGVSVIVQALASNIWIKGVSASGTLHAQAIDKWAGLGLKTQYTRK